MVQPLLNGKRSGAAGHGDGMSVAAAARRAGWPASPSPKMWPWPLPTGKSRRAPLTPPAVDSPTAALPESELVTELLAIELYKRRPPYRQKVLLSSPEAGRTTPDVSQVSIEAMTVLDEHVMEPWKPGGAMSTNGKRAYRRSRGQPTWRIVRYADLCRARHKSARGFPFSRSRAGRRPSMAARLAAVPGSADDRALLEGSAGSSVAACRPTMLR